MSYSTYKQRNRELNDAARTWRGGYQPYDLVKEATIALGVVALIAVVLAILFSSPDEHPSSIRSWSRGQPVDFVTTAVSELDGSSGTAGYGPPYNHAQIGQHIAFIHLQQWFGVAHPINTAQDYVIGPLSQIPGQPALQAAVATYTHASASQQAKWTTAYSNALAHADVEPQPTKTKPETEPAGASDVVVMPPGNYGPVTTMMNALLLYAQAGGLDGALLRSGQFYSTDYTKILMFLADGGLLASRAQAEHLLGTQWGMMNETGSFPGQSWLWLYTFWYQIKPFSTSANADILVVAVMGVLSVLFVLVPFLPGVRDLPRKIRVYRLIWREHYASGS